MKKIAALVLVLAAGCAEERDDVESQDDGIVTGEQLCHDPVTDEQRPCESSDTAPSEGVTCEEIAACLDEADEYDPDGDVFFYCEQYRAYDAWADAVEAWNDCHYVYGDTYTRSECLEEMCE